ncbi:nuclear transport factor 2 family protein [Fulvivirga sp.]|uniref:nuclear transport factor 2 family protein n=1 Tax=Fulvivirga sp. TaxID=1931237 RepID=UPI0032ED75B2
MDKSILIGLIGMLLSACATAQQSETEAIKATIKNFSNAGDFNDAKTLDKYLDENYRVVMNQLFGSTEVVIMPRSVYLEKIASKEFGGDSRDITIEKVLVNGNTASAKVTFKGTKMTFVSIVTLVKHQNGEWKMLSDVPVVI